MELRGQLTRAIRKKELKSAPSEFMVTLQPHYENDDEFLKRTHSVQDLLTRIILLSRKRGRPSLKEVSYEQAA